MQVTVPGSELPGWKCLCWSSELRKVHLAWLSISCREGQHVLPLAAGTWNLSALWTSLWHSGSKKKNVTDEIITFKYSLGLCSLALSWGIVTLQTNQLKRYSQSGDLWPPLVSQDGHTVTHALDLTWEVSRQAFQETLTKYSCVIWPRSPQTLISTEILCNDHSSMHKQRILVWEREDLLNLATALKKKEKKEQTTKPK